MATSASAAASAAAAAAQAAAVKALVESGAIRPIVTYADVAASTLFVYDYLLTLSLEVDLIWSSRWNVIKILFILQRYLPFIDTCFLTLYRQLAILTFDFCKTSLLPYISGFLYLLGFALSEILLTLRVWALWDRDKRLSIALGIAFPIIWAPAFYTMYLYVASLKYIPQIIPGALGCMVVDAREVVIWSWVSLLVWNTITLGLTIAHCLRSNRSGITSPRLAVMIYRDGAYYYIYLFTFSLLNIFLTTQLQPAKRVILLSIERCLHSMFASRVLLHMRSQASRPTHEPQWSSSGIGPGSSPGVHLHSTHSYKQDVPELDSGYVMHLRRLTYVGNKVEIA